MMLRLSPVQSNVGTLRPFVSCVGSPDTCSCSSFCRKTLPPPAQRVHAHEREISAIWRNDGGDIGEIRGRHV